MICLANLAYYGYSLTKLPGAISMIAKHDALSRYILIARVTWLFFSGILIWSLVHVYQLIRSISKKGPFSIENPRRVRKIAFGALALALVSLTSEMLSYLLTPGTLKILLYNLMGVPMWVSFFGLVLLVIARVFEEGLKLKESDNLTI